MLSNVLQSHLFKHTLDLWIVWKFDECKYFNTLKYLQLDWWQFHASSPRHWLILHPRLMTISPSPSTLTHVTDRLTISKRKTYQFWCFGSDIFSCIWRVRDSECRSCLVYLVIIGTCHRRLSAPHSPTPSSAPVTVFRSIVNNCQHPHHGMENGMIHSH